MLRLVGVGRLLVLAVLGVSGCTASHVSANWYPSRSPAIISSDSEVPSSHPPGAVVADLGRCTRSEVVQSSARVQAPEDWRKRLSVKTTQGERLDVITPAAFLPLRLAHMPAFAPEMCVLDSKRHGDWAKTSIFIVNADVGSLTTRYKGDGQWSGRPLVTLNSEG